MPQALFLRVLRLFPALLLTLATLGGGPAQAQSGIGRGAVVTTPQARTELLAHAPEGVAPGRTVWVGLRIAHKEHWHTYWKNPGDSGLPTEFQWTLPPGVQAGDISWPLPKKLPVGPLMNYGYEGTLLLPVPLTITSDFKPGLLGQDLAVQLRASWLICKTECIPEEGEYTLRIPLRSSTALHGALFEAAQQAQPRPLAAAPASSIRIQGQTLQLVVAGLPERLRGQKLEAFPEVAEVINPAAPWTQRWDGAVWTAELPLAPQRSASPKVLPVVLASGTQGWRAELPVRDAWPATAAPAAISPALQAALDANAAAQGSAPTLGFWAALTGALIGGLILNLMPCVFPVLAIKVLSFTRHADDHRRHRVSGLAYTAGVIVSFLALGLLLLGLRSAGVSLGWGFQLQDPLVIAALAALFTVIALNLAGVFEFGQFAPSSLAAFQARHPVVDAFLTGVLAVAVASPCTAPFMGASLGLAITLPAGQALLIFAALGLGLALPYLVASFVPAFARWLPRPGAWMDTLRKLLAFPMLVTVVWLVWVLGHQSGVDGAAALLVLLVALSALIWALTLRGRLRAVLGGLLLAAGAWSVWALGPYLFMSPAPMAQAADARWQAWSPARQQELLAAGKTVFVDYTAAWCVTCQYNKQTTLADAALLGEFDTRGIVMLRADWTRRDPAITTALGQLGRNGVPVYVFYRAGRAPLVLSEVLSTGEVRQALNSI
jgi:thiol:disulfide interchange protein/DsbC/DsbD-like thiol-disulfide interchange protein